MADWLVLPRLAKSLQKGAGFSEKLEHSKPAEKERAASVQQVSSWQVRQSRLEQKEKEQSCLSNAPDREVGEGDQSGSMKRKGWTP